MNRHIIKVLFIRLMVFILLISSVPVSGFAEEINKSSNDLQKTTIEDASATEPNVGEIIE